MSAPMRASNSSIQAFKRCRRKWWLTYELGWSPRERAITGPLALGSRVHKALEAMYAGGEDPVVAHARMVEDEKASMLLDYADIDKLENDAELGRVMLEGYVEWVEREGLDDGLEIIGVEEKLELPLLDNEVLLIGKMDLRAKDRENVRSVLDFKHQPLSEPVLTPDGWVAMGDLAAGDYVIGSGWTPVRVLDVYDAGVKDVWEIEFTDHTTVRCSDEHVWPIMVDRPFNSVRMMETAEIVARTGASTRRTPQNLYVQPVSPAKGVDVDLPVHPYVLGAWIANGSRNTPFVHDGATDYELSILRRVARIEGAGEVTFPDHRSSGRAVAKISPKSVAALRECGLYGTYSTGRFIPSAYLYQSSLAQRRDLMFGLMDSDGTVTGASTTQYQTSSPRLAEQVALLARSLGWHASVWTQDAPWYTHKGERRTGQRNYRIMMRTTETPFLRHTRNTEKWNAIEGRRKTAKQHLPKKIKSVTRVQSEECRCIRVDADDHLYVTTGGVLTHNTAASFSDYDLVNLYEQGPTYWALDRATDPSDRIDAFTLRLLKKVKRSARATPPFYEQIHVRFNAFTMRSFWTRLHGTLHDMVRARRALERGDDPLTVVYPTPKRDCRWDCNFVTICHMFDDGSAVQQALEDNFEQGDPFAYYGNDEEKEA